MDTILKIDNVKKYFGNKEVLKGISLEVREGEIISVLGPSGCGKSTLLNLIAGILPLDSGSISIKGKVVSDKSREEPPEKRNVNMVFQDFALWPHMKAGENILYGLNVRKTGREEQAEKLGAVVSMLHLEGLLDHYPSELSGGQQQRVAIARALITRPSIILLDEPLCNLDVQLRVEMRTEMSQLFHSLKTTVFHVTHDPSEAFAMADRIVVMDNGLIDQDDTPENCYLKPKTAMVAGLLGAGNRISGTVLADEDGDFCEVSVNGARLSGTRFKPGHATKSGKIKITGIRNCEIRFRPEECSFLSEKSENCLPVKVILSSFEGGVYRIKVRSAGGEELCVLHKSFLAPGCRGFLKVDKERLYVYT